MSRGGFLRTAHYSESDIVGVKYLYPSNETGDVISILGPSRIKRYRKANFSLKNYQGNAHWWYKVRRGSWIYVGYFDQISAVLAEDYTLAIFVHSKMSYHEVDVRRF